MVCEWSLDLLIVLVLSLVCVNCSCFEMGEAVLQLEAEGREFEVLHNASCCFDVMRF